MNIQKYICPKCNGECKQRKIKNSVVYDCNKCGEQVSSEAIKIEEE